jgi:SAM-dependent methyltransferase
MNRSAGYDEYAFVADFYDYVTPYQERRDVRFFVEMAQEARGRVLELGCGTGRVLIPTARAGIEMVGVDASTKMLLRCREKLGYEPAKVQSRVKLLEADMREFDIQHAFGLAPDFQLVTLPFRPFQHLLTVEDQLACLGCIRGHLAPGGRVILDVFNPSLPHLAGRSDLADVIGEEPEFTMPDGRHVLRSHRIVSRNFFDQTQEVEIIYDVTHPGGRWEQLRHRFTMRHLFRFEAEHLLARSGFRMEEVYADYDRSPYGSKYPGELIFVARRE